MIVNIHTVPEGEYDANIPFLGDVYAYASNFVSRIKDLKSDIVLVNNGEPNTRLESAREMLSRNGISSIIKYKTSKYHKEDMLFKEGYNTCSIEDLQNDCKKLIDYYILVYKNLPKNSQQQGDADILYGFTEKGRTGAYWYQYGNKMPTTNDVRHKQIYKQFENIFQKIVKSFALKLGWNEQNIKEQLILRINHNPPGSYNPYSKKENILLDSHWDTSVLTSWAYTTHPGAYIQIANEMIPIEKLYNSSKEMLLIPGIDYCDAFETMTAPTLHHVKDQTKMEDRIGLVAFLKRKTSKD